MTTINVTHEDIRHGKAGDCFNCAVALALWRVTEDDHAQVFEADYLLRLECWSRSIVAPWEVTQFVGAFDSLERDDNGQVIFPDEMPDELQPFTFEIPDGNDPEWDEECPGCQRFIKADEQDDEGYCAECCEREAV